jgi:DnaJ family protein C protein 22
MSKSLSIAYVCCIFGGLFGLHHFYLGRDRQGIIYFTTLGGFLVGIAYDLFKMPDYVNEANLDRSYLIDLKRSMNSEPSFAATRFISCLVVGTFFNYLVSNCIHFDNSQEELRVLLILIVPLIESFIVHFIGTDGPYACNN